MDKYPKEIIIEILLAKLDSSKTFDWHDLSQRLAPKEQSHTDMKRKNRSRKGDSNSKKQKETHLDSRWTGTQLHDMYHYEIIPALRAGRVPWVNISPEPSTPSTAPPTTPQTDSMKRQISDVDDDENLPEKDQGKAIEGDSHSGLLEMPVLKKTKSSRASTKTTRRRRMASTSESEEL
ncbi:hypothetical protein BCR39DRAFT_556978 [Naematelia encephala]|uniref:Uncharacterized protein n=1 Tax=Naematelia encephala TaxID=71784 RepID=A0A1Y2BFZ9_9TREE|nr:hypothetical protein BCR39DRAFT_556978 [Naematelia encephala]